MTDTIRTHEDLDQYGSIGATTELMPAAGKGTAVRPPTFASKSKSPDWKDKIALSQPMPIPSRDAEGAWSEVVREGDGQKPRLAAAVLINSLGAEARQFSETLLSTGIDWGRIEVAPPSADRIDALLAKPSAPLSKVLSRVGDRNTFRDVVQATVRGAQIDSWRLSHRIADADIRYAADPATGKQLWASGNPLKARLIESNPLRDASWLWRNAANALLFGYWSSNTGSSMRPKWARALSSEIYGYGAELLSTGAMKGSAYGDLANDLKLTKTADGGITFDGLHTGKTENSVKPSTRGMGQVPGPLGPSAVVCEVILRRSGLSLTHLRQMRVLDGDGKPAPQLKDTIVRAAAAAGIYAIAASSAEGLFLRSGTDLSPHSTVWTAHQRNGKPAQLDVSVDGARALLESALAQAETLGLGQAGATVLAMSDAQLEAIIANAAVEGAKDTTLGDVDA